MISPSKQRPKKRCPQDDSAVSSEFSNLSSSLQVPCSGDCDESIMEIEQFLEFDIDPMKKFIAEEQSLRRHEQSNRFDILESDIDMDIWES